MDRPLLQKGGTLVHKQHKVVSVLDTLLQAVLQKKAWFSCCKRKEAEGLENIKL
jgi:hypothetical protein